MSGKSHSMIIDKTKTSPTEQYFYKIHKTNPSSKSLLLYKDVFFNGLILQCNEVVELLKLAINLHPIAHTGFEDVKLNAIQEEKTVLRKILTTQQALDYDVVHALDENILRPFDLTLKGPIRFVFSEKPNLAIRFVFHRIGFDVKAADLFVEDFILLLRFLGKSNNVGPYKCTHPRDAFETLDRHLASNYEVLKNIWEKDLSKMIISKTTLSTMKTKKRRKGIKGSENFHIAYMSFTTNTSKKILALTVHKKTSLLNLVISLYQLFLSLHSSTKYITVVTEYDQRQLIIGSDQLVESMTNLVPITSKVPKKETSIENFIMQNGEKIDVWLSRAVFPFSDLCQLMSKTSRKHINRHLVVERQNGNRELGPIQMATTRHVGISQETVISYFYDIERDRLHIQLHTQEDAFTSQQTIKILERFAKMLRFISRNPQITMSEMRDYIFNDTNLVSLQDTFTKIDTNGCSYQVNLALYEEGPTGFTLRWTTLGETTSKFISFNVISNIHIISRKDSKALWIKTRNGNEETFIFPDDNKVNMWVRRLEEVVNWDITQV